ncbi:hypothetical protein DL239_07320 [Sedimentitalea sp. CY04]|uniref:Calcium-binding protein n=1 Tax=Parasedimentitalea denitrificans TaxID=2211118 RepID=A0ABX0W9F0_9RHOB|nr:calcium-binding protein [Sedimentitalea sp. CY04]NIZ60781.1 hypothetical protein [Sedimentitalea sp. CY04]
MIWMTLIGLGLVAGIAIHSDDEELDTSSDDNDQPPVYQETDVPTNDNDFLQGTNGADTLLGAGGDDLIYGEDGNDREFGNSGNDRLYGDGGDDSLFGGSGNDFIHGGLGDDSILGGDGNDILVDGKNSTGSDTIQGGPGHDVILGEAGDDSLNGGTGNDFIFDQEGTDTLKGSSGNDAIISSGFWDETEETPEWDFSKDTDLEGDVVEGGYGNDDITFGIDDTVTGGAGEDYFIVGDWLAGDGSATVTDFDSEEDTLVYLFDDGETPPVITSTLKTNSEGGVDAFVLADGQEVVRLVGAGPTFDPASHSTFVTKSVWVN